MKYRGNPVLVDAEVITQVACMPDGSVNCTVGQSQRIATPEMVSRYVPVEGDYWVTQSDGYEYVNPKAVFERKYTPQRSDAPLDLHRAQGRTAEIEQAVYEMFEYHQWTPEQIKAGQRVRYALECAALTIIEFVPPGPDRTVAMRKLREARMDANSAITHGGKY